MLTVPSTNGRPRTLSVSVAAIAAVISLQVTQTVASVGP